MNLNDNVFSGDDLEKALTEGTLNVAKKTLTGIAKPAAKSGYISFSPTDCDGWVDLSTNMIDRAEHLGYSGCRDHSHPVMRITLTEPKSDEGRVLFALLPHGTMPSTPTPSAATNLSTGAIAVQGPTLSGVPNQHGDPARYAPQLGFGFGGFGGTTGSGSIEGGDRRFQLVDG